MSNFTLIDELVDFTNELIYLIKQDWEKFKIFVKEYKKYVFWIIVLLITMQFTDLMSLGSSWEKYCNKNGISNNKNIDKNNDIDKDKNNDIQSGGSASPTGATATPPPVDKRWAITRKLNSMADDRKAGLEKQKAEKKEKQKDIKGRALKKAFGPGSEAKDIEKKLGWFKQFKANIGNGAGPVFGNIDRIFKYTEAMFVILTSILIIVGVLSLPVLIFLIITYCVIKMMVGKFMIL
jgi:hypothetical protein